MQRFQYTALDLRGNSHVGTCEADSRAGALAVLKSQDLRPTKLEVASNSDSQLPRVGQATVARFYMMLADQLQVGVPLLNALELIERQEASDEAKRLVGDIAQRVSAGDSLSDAMNLYLGVFSEIDINLVRAGEEGGFLPDSLARVSEMREWQQKLTASVWGAAAYPILLVSVSMLLIPAVLIFLVPKLEPIFASLRRTDQLPWATTLLLSTSEVLRNYGGLFIGLLILAILSVTLLVPTEYLSRLRDRLVLRTPMLGIVVRDFVLARFFRVLGTLLQNKIQMLPALEIATQVLGNDHMKSSIQDTYESVASGRMLTDALRKTDSIPPDALAMIGVGEQSNTLDFVLIKIAQQFEARTNRRLESGIKLIEPILLLLMAVFVGFTVLALLLPIFEGQAIG